MTDTIGQKAAKQNQALQPFAFLIGEWKTTGSHPYFPDAELHGQVSFEWIEGGAFILQRTQVDHPDFPDGIEIFGSDDDTQTFYMLHFDERGVSRRYDVAMTETELSWHRDNTHFSQRYTIDVKNKEKLIGLGEMSRDGGAWEGDLSLTYERK